jgi:hypothetical protein
MESGSLGKKWKFVARTINELLSQSDISPQSLSRSPFRTGIARCRSDVDGALRVELPPVSGENCCSGNPYIVM